MYIVNTEKTRSLNIDGVEFLADQPIVGFTPERLKSLIADELVIEVADDEVHLKSSEILVNRNAAQARALAGASGIDLDDPSGLTKAERANAIAEEEAMAKKNEAAAAKKKADDAAVAKATQEAAEKKKADEEAARRKPAPNVIR